MEEPKNVEGKLTAEDVADRRHSRRIEWVTVVFTCFRETPMIVIQLCISIALGAALLRRDYAAVAAILTVLRFANPFAPSLKENGG